MFIKIEYNRVTYPNQKNSLIRENSYTI